MRGSHVWSPENRRRWGVAGAIVIAIVLVAGAHGSQDGPAATPASDRLFDPVVIQEIRLVMKPEDWATLLEEYRENTYYPADLVWQDLTVPIVGVRSRGTGSRNGSKPALRVDINRYVDQKFLGLEALVLANAIQDPSMIRQRLGMLFYARMGQPAPRVVHTRLFVNDEYVGLYQLIEEIAKPFLPRAFGRSVNGTRENNGYLYEYNWKDGYGWDYLGADLGVYADLFGPKTHESDPPSVLYGPLEGMFRTLNQVDDAAFEGEVSRFIDLAGFVEFLAVDSFLSDTDGFLGKWGVNNIYLYRLEESEQSVLIPWDKDSAFQDIQADLFHNVDSNVLAKRALAIPRLRRAYLEGLLRCAELAMAPDTPGSPTGWLEAEVARQAEQIRDAALADGRKWYSNERFLDELNKVQRFAAERGPFVASEARKALGR